jgi:hypothetical protein
MSNEAYRLWVSSVLLNKILSKRRDRFLPPIHQNTKFSFADLRFTKLDVRDLSIWCYLVN